MPPQRIVFNHLNKWHMHPFTKILLFIMTLLLTSMVNANALALVAFFLLCAVLIRHKNFIYVLLRMRWLFLSIFLIYALGTPGELISLFPIYFAPTYEGLQMGVMQIMRLLIALAALNLLVNASPRQEMITGLYLWLLPFKYLGLNAERFAARLMLTLHYVEAFAEQGQKGLNFSALDHAHNTVPDPALNRIHLQQKPFQLLDKCLLLMALLLVAVLVYWNLS